MPTLTGIDRNLTHYADPGFSRYLRRALLASAGYDEADLEREERRLAVQAELDTAKDQAERNRMGQFATPTELAVQILEYAKGQLNETEAVRFIDPAIGTGSFYSALLKVFPADRLTRAVGYEVDPHYGEPATRLWKGTMLDVRLGDFTLAAPPSDKEKFNLLV